MSHIADTSFLCSLYRRQEFSPRAIAFARRLDGPLRVSSLLLLEFRQSVRLQSWLHAGDRTKGFAAAEGEAMLRDLQADLAAKVVAVVPVDWAEAHQFAERLSATYTPRRGHRMTDILHVATALHLGAREFLSFDRNQRLLAEAEGLTLSV